MNSFTFKLRFFKQQLLVDKNFLIYRASAGSGKTYNLVIQYLLMCLSVPDGNGFTRALAVTFTNKAAGEMKERILSYLKILQADRKDLSEKEQKTKADISKLLTEELGISQIELEKRAFLTIVQILNHYSRFGVSTIDKFNMRLVRTFETELYGEAGLELVLDNREYLAQAVSWLIDRAGLDEQVTQWIMAFLIETLETDNSKIDIESKLNNFLQALFNEAFADKIKPLINLDVSEIEQIKDFDKNRIEAFNREFTKLIEPLKSLIDNKLINEDQFHNKSRGPFSWWLKLCNSNKVAPTPSVVSVGDKLVKVPNAHTDKVASIHEQLITLFTEKHDDYNSAQKFQSQLFLAVMAKDLIQWLDTIKSRNKLLFLAEVNNKLKDLIVGTPVPFIYEQLGERYNHYLVDEFQDTSITQWQNFIPLLANSLAKGKRSLVVGDGKQSIYRFRGGQVEQFESLPEIYKRPNNLIYDEYEASLKRNAKIIALQNNFRSAAAIVEFNNSFVHFVAGLNDTFNKIYHDGKQQFQSQQNGYVLIQGFEYTKTDEGDEEHEQQEADPILTQVLNDFKEIQKSGALLSDWCILTPKKNQGALIAHQLGLAGIPVISEESLLVMSDSSVSLIHHLFVLLYTPFSQEGIYHVIKNLALHTNLDPCTCALRFLQGKHLKRFNEDAFWLYLSPGQKGAEYKRMNPLSLLMSLIDILKLDGHFNQHMHRYLEQVSSNEKNLGLDPFAHIRWWSTNKDKVAVLGQGAQNAVRIMTIHKSKGLEFKKLMLPYVSSMAARNDGKYTFVAHPYKPGNKTIELPLGLRSSDPNTKMAYDQEQELILLDHINTLYVALTRAERELRVYFKLDKRAKAGKIFMDFLEKDYQWSESNFRLEIGTRPKVDSDELQEKKPDEKNTIQAGNIKFKKIASDRSLVAPQLNQWDEPRQWGNLVHELLSHVEIESDLPLECAKLKNKYTLETEQAQKLEQDVRRIINVGKKEAWFPGNGICKSELQLASSPSEQSENLRVDRVIFAPDKTWLIEFKTGEPNQEHVNQVRNYARVLQSMNYPNIEARLMYLNQEQSILVDL